MRDYRQFTDEDVRYAVLACILVMVLLGVFVAAAIYDATSPPDEFLTEQILPKPVSDFPPLR